MEIMEQVIQINANTVISFTKSHEIWDIQTPFFMEKWTIKKSAGWFSPPRPNRVNPISVRWVLLHENGVLEVSNFVTFPNSLWTFRKSKKNFWFFTVFWGDLEGAGWFSPPPLSSNIQEPALLGLKIPKILFYLCLHNWSDMDNSIRPGTWEALLL